MLISELNAVRNLVAKKRFQIYNLVGHEKTITSLDAKFGMIVSGSKDNTVKIWDIQKKKAYTYTKHMNVVSSVLMWDERSALSASADRTIRFWGIGNEDDCKLLKGHGAAVS